MCFESKRYGGGGIDGDIVHDAQRGTAVITFLEAEGLYNACQFVSSYSLNSIFDI